MSELMFSIKCLVVTIAIIVAMQLKVDGVSIEERSYRWLRKSETSQYIQSAAAGGVLVIKNASEKATEFVKDKSENLRSDVIEAARK